MVWEVRQRECRGGDAEGIAKALHRLCEVHLCVSVWRDTGLACVVGEWRIGDWRDGGWAMSGARVGGRKVTRQGRGTG